MQTNQMHKQFIYMMYVAVSPTHSNIADAHIKFFTKGYVKIHLTGKKG